MFLIMSNTQISIDVKQKDSEQKGSITIAGFSIAELTSKICQNVQSIGLNLPLLDIYILT